MTRLRPSVNPSFCSSATKARYPSPPETASSSPVLSTPIRATCVDGCCARAESGHAAAPPTSVMNSRRLIVAPRGQNHAPHRLTAVRVLERGEGGCELRPIVLGWQCRLWVPRPASKPKSSVSADAFPVCPRQRTYLPILELLPPPAFRELRHRGLARRLVASAQGKCARHGAPGCRTLS